MVMRMKLGDATAYIRLDITPCKCHLTHPQHPSHPMIHKVDSASIIVQAYPPQLFALKKGATSYMVFAKPT